MIGQVYFREANWVIECEPHIKARLKRVFPRAPQQAARFISVSNTPENCRDLRWFLERYPMDVERPELLDAQAKAHVNSELRFADMMARRQPLFDVTLEKPARDYQVLAANALEIKGGLLVADDVGTGKTITAICSMVAGDNLPTLVVCPTHLPRQWANKIAEFAPSLSTHIITKGTPYPIKRGERGGAPCKFKDEMPDVIITNYHKLRGWAEQLAGHVQLVVFDECQQLRKSGSEIYSACEHVAERARRREGLSATPIYNYGGEFFWVINILLPGALGSHGEFLREWCTAHGGDKARLKSAEEFGSYLRREGIMLRRTRRDVGRELPDLTKVIHTIDADPSYLEQLQGDAVRLAEIILGSNEAFRGQKMQAAGEFDAMMRQATGIAKAPFVAEFVRLLLESERRVVLFGWHHEVYNIWRERLKEFRPVQYTGQESPSQKAATIEAFRSLQSRVLVMSLRSGAGVDGLQEFCRTIVFGELDWSPGVHEQCIGRLHRDGQDEPCTAYFLTAEHGADPIMIDVLGIKREQIESVNNPGRPLVERAESGDDALKRLARELLTTRGIRIAEKAPPVFARAEV